MIITEPTENAAGVIIWGDYWDLHSLHETISELCEEAPFGVDIQETVLGLAYDIRHAYQRGREEKEFGFDVYDKVTYRGCKVLWPIILFQINVLRQFASYQPTTKEQQANLYKLESCIEQSINDTDKNLASECIEWMRIPLPVSDKYYSLALSDAAKKYVLGPVSKLRFKKLISTLRSIHPWSDEYKAFATALEAEASKQGCSPFQLDDLSSEGPEIIW